jgi:rhodanese-related sulfurtransferase
LRRVLFYPGDFIIINSKLIFGIIITSSILGLAINYFNPSGIPLIREKIELKWAPDSLFLKPERDSIVTIVDSIKLSTSPKIEEQKQVNQELSVNDKKESKNIILGSDQKNEEITKKGTEIIAFPEPKAIKLEQAFTLYNKGVLFIDARDEGDFLAGHISNSINIPFDDFDNHKQKLEEISKEKPLVIYCAGTDCDLSVLLGNLLFEKGYKQVYVFFGGWVEWLDANYPVEHSPESK